jgi:hypothetical protein
LGAYKKLEKLKNLFLYGSLLRAEFGGLKKAKKVLLIPQGTFTQNFIKIGLLVYLPKIISKSAH